MAYLVPRSGSVSGLKGSFALLDEPLCATSRGIRWEFGEDFPNEYSLMVNPVLVPALLPRIFFLLLA